MLLRHFSPAVSVCWKQAAWQCGCLCLRFKLLFVFRVLRASGSERCRKFLWAEQGTVAVFHVSAAPSCRAPAHFR